MICAASGSRAAAASSKLSVGRLMKSLMRRGRCASGPMDLTTIERMRTFWLNYPHTNINDE